MKADAMKNMSEHELQDQLKDVEKRLFELRFQSATDRLETPSAIKKARRDIARLKTVLRQREMAQKK